MMVRGKWVVLAVLVLVSSGSSVFAHQGAISGTTAAAFAGMSLSLVGTSAGVSGTTASADKRVLAAAAIEDAAHFYQTGELTGVLPQVLVRMRELDSALERSADAELVDAVVETAQAFLQ